jgi:hypothetical protein
MPLPLKVAARPLQGTRQVLYITIIFSYLLRPFILTNQTNTCLLIIQTYQIAETLIPRDFIKDKNQLTKAEVEARFGVAGRYLFNKSQRTAQDEENGNPAAIPAVPNGLTASEDFAIRIRELRKFVMDMILPRLRETWLCRFLACVPNEEYANVKSFEDFLYIYRTQPYHSKRRSDVNIVCNEMWGQGHCFVEIEREIMAKLKLKYTDTLVGGEKCKTRRKSGSIKGLTNRMKQTLFCDLLRHIGRDKYMEVIYNRYMKTPMKGVVKVIKVTKMSHGFDGYLGLCDGHPGLLVLDKTVITPKRTPALTLHEYLVEKVKSGSVKTTAEHLEEWEKEQGNKNMVVSVSVQDSTASPLTDSDRSSTPKQNGLMGEISDPIVSS